MKGYLLSISIAMLAIVLSFSFHLSKSWQHYMDDYGETTVNLNEAINETLTSYYQEREHTKTTEEEINFFLPLILGSNDNFGAGYYIDKTKAFHTFGTQLQEQDYLEIQNNFSREVNAAKLLTLREDYYKGDMIYTFTPIIVNDEQIGYSWSLLMYESFWQHFKGEFLLVAQFLFWLLLISILGVKLIFRDYKKKIQEFKKVIRYSNIVPANALNIETELLPIYEEINKTRADIVESERRFRDVVTAFQEFVWEIDLDGNYTYLSNKVETMLGYSVYSLLGQRFFEIIDEPFQQPLQKVYEHHIKHHSIFKNIEFTQTHKNGTTISLCANGVPIFDDEHRIIGYRGATRDISEEKKHEQEIQFLAYYDQLTRLPNRTSLIGTMEELLNANEPFALAFIDLDQFKSVNDSLSHTVGDELLKMTAQIFINSIQPSDSVYRFGGDEFIIVFTNVQGTNDVKARIHKVLENLAVPIEIDQVQLFNTASIGVSLFPEHGDNTESLIKRADIAMYKSKHNGRNQVTFYSEDFQGHVTENFELAHDLKDAIGTEQLFLVYQPQVDLQTNEIVGVEALLRWNHPKKGFIPPDKFIPIAEEHGSILPLGKWIIEQACSDRKQWLDQGYGAFKTAINISIKQFEQLDFVEQVLTTLSDCALNPAYIELEITEGVAMNDPAIVIDKLKTLKEEGFYIAIDDFGMGYSSLNYLKNLPINRLKIDRSFIIDIHSNSDYAIVQSIIAMAKSLQLAVVAEGVETIEHVNILRSLHCDIAQGYYYYKPMPKEQLLQQLALMNN